MKFPQAGAEFRQFKAMYSNASLLWAKPIRLVKISIETCYLTRSSWLTYAVNSCLLLASVKACPAALAIEAHLMVASAIGDWNDGKALEIEAKAATAIIESFMVCSYVVGEWSVAGNRSVVRDWSKV